MLLPELALDCDPSISVFCVAGITDTHHYAQPRNIPLNLKIIISMKNQKKKKTERGKEARR
jgi:hypothetical protein